MSYNINLEKLIINAVDLLVVASEEKERGGGERKEEEEVNLTNSTRVSASWVPVVKIRLHFGTIFPTELLTA